MNDAVIFIESFTTPNRFYLMSTEKRSCTCPAFRFRGTCKHVRKFFGKGQMPKLYETGKLPRKIRVWSLKVK